MLPYRLLVNPGCRVNDVKTPFPLLTLANEEADLAWIRGLRNYLEPFFLTLSFK